ncbi:MAG TPA: hybrid sensor histidine kinase/response regulator [Phycisphaerae bacterium]|nr:hybrid sensor histidine kinase/response regulator [Phycisphaerae bacterium]
MTCPVPEQFEERALLVPPTARDGALTCELLRRSGIEATALENMGSLLEELERGAGAVLLTEDLIGVPAMGKLVAFVEHQPGWSDLPIIMQMRGANESLAASRLLRALGNVTLLERPASIRSLVSAVRTAIRSRRRQYMIRDQMRQIAEARAEAERLSRIKDEFLATLSHELRTPLNAIFGWTQLLKQGQGDARMVAEGVAAIDRNVRVQTQLIEDLLDVSRIISGKLHLKRQMVEAATVVAAAMESVKPAADAKRIGLEARLDAQPAPLMGDAARLQQVLWNLLSNAIKFTPEGGAVTVSTQRAGDMLRMVVTDTGEGISPDFLPHMFERFSQADASSTRKHGGLGLGLSIVKSLVEMHGGTVGVLSTGRGEGTAFTVELPLHVPEAGAPRAAPGVLRPLQEHHPEVRGLKVLVVDDEPDARDVVRRFLLACEAVPAVAASAAEAYVLLAEFKPDVILSDIGMPGEDGYQFIRAVRKNGIGVPAVAVTAFARTEDRARSLEAGFQSHMPKPVEPAELLTVIAELAGARR